MKILLIDVYHFNKGGAETVCFNTGKMLEENGHEVIYFTLKWNKNLPLLSKNTSLNQKRLAKDYSGKLSTYETISIIPMLLKIRATYP